MKSLAQLAVLLGFAAFAAPAICAQTVKWRMDAGHSVARIFLAQSGDPDPGLNVAVAMVAGTMDLDCADASRLSIKLTIFPADQAQALLNPDGSLRADAYAALSRYTIMTFQSKPAVRDPSGKLQLTGNITVTYVEREAPGDWNVGYSGAVVIPPVTKSFTREVSFTFEKSASEIAYGRKVGWIEMTGFGKIPLEENPRLRDWLWSSVWPMVVEDRNCYMPNYSVSMRDYQGAVCTGNVVPTKPPKEAPHSFGVDYSGARLEAPEKIDEVRILFDLKLREPQ